MQINLVPEAQDKKNRAKKANNYALLFSVGLVIATVAGLILLGSLYFVQKGINSANTKKIANAKEEIAKYKEIEDLVVSLQKGLEASRLILKQEGDVTKLLTNLEGATPTDVRFKSLTVSDGTIEGSVEAKSVEALGKMERSLKSYTVVFLSGSGNPGESVKLVMGEKEYTAQVRTDGRWYYALKVDPTKDFSIKVVTSSQDEATVTYTAAEKEITTSGGVQANIRTLFSVPEIKSYENSANGTVSFTLKVNFDKEVLW